MLNNDAKDIEISLKDILLLIKRYRSRLLILPVISTVLAIIFVANMPAVWDATCIIQVGQIAKAQQDDPDAPSAQLIEFQEYTILRLQNTPFATKENLSRLGKLRVANVKNQALIEIKLKTNSFELAQTSMQKIIAQLKLVHQQLFSAHISRLQLKMKGLDERIQILLVEKKIFENKLKVESKHTSNSELYIAILNLKNLELNDFVPLRQTIKEQLNSERTFQTRTVGDITVVSVSETIKKVSIIVTALILGFCGSLLLAFLHKSYVDLD